MGILLANLPWTPLFPQGLKDFHCFSATMQLYRNNILYRYLTGLVYTWYATLYTSKPTVMTQIIITCSYHVHCNLKQFTGHESSHLPSWKKSKPWCYTNHPCTALAPSGQLRVWKLPHGFYTCSNKILTTINSEYCKLWKHNSREAGFFIQLHMQLQLHSQPRMKYLPLL